MTWGYGYITDDPAALERMIRLDLKTPPSPGTILFLASMWEMGDTPFGLPPVMGVTPSRETL